MGVVKGDTRSLDYSSYGVFSATMSRLINQSEVPTKLSTRNLTELSYSLADFLRDKGYRLALVSAINGVSHKQWLRR